MFNKPKGLDMVPNDCQHLPLDQETRTVLPTAVAAFHLNRSQQTLRWWAMREGGPLRPLRVHGRLAWPTAEIRKLLGVTA